MVKQALPLQTLAIVVTVVALLAPTASAANVQPAPLPPLQATWMRADQPVASGRANRTWLWGPQDTAYWRTESYIDSPGSQREVIYYDKARMEVTRPAGDTSSPWYVTNGLLVIELMTGRMQTGDASFENRAPANVNVAGDPTPGNGPTYATLGQLRDAAPAPDGAALTTRIDAAGAMIDDTAMARYGASAAQRVRVDGIDHQVASPFWDFMNATGVVYDGGAYSEAPLFLNPFYATGYPVTEAYWTTVAVAGTLRDVLLQCFERRCLTYTPDNPEGWKVEAGNVGLHYYRWRYGEERPAPPALSVTFNLIYGGQQIARTITQESFLGGTAVGRWTTTAADGRELSRGTLVAEHPVTGVAALIVQDAPIPGSASFEMRYAFAFPTLSGTGTLEYRAEMSDGIETGSVNFTATATALDVWDVTLDALPPVFFGGS